LRCDSSDGLKEYVTSEGHGKNESFCLVSHTSHFHSRDKIYERENLKGTKGYLKSPFFWDVAPRLWVIVT